MIPTMLLAGLVLGVLMTRPTWLPLVALLWPVLLLGDSQQDLSTLVGGYLLGLVNAGVGFSVVWMPRRLIGRTPKTS